MGRDFWINFGQGLLIFAGAWVVLSIQIDPDSERAYLDLQNGYYVASFSAVIALCYLGARQFMRSGRNPHSKNERPFLGIVENADPWSIDVYLVNNASQAFSCEKRQGSFQGDDAGFMNLGHSKWEKFQIRPYAAVKIDQLNDDGELDFKTWYELKIGERHYETSIGGLGFYTKPTVVLPILERTGYRYEFDSRF